MPAPTRKLVGLALGIAIALAIPAEGIVKHVYADVGGVPTICYGETQGVHAGDTTTGAECVARLEARMPEYLAAVDTALPGQPDTRRGALAYFCYNEGIHACQHSSVFRKIKAGDVKGGCNALLLWDKAGGKVRKHIREERQRERTLCLAGT